MQMYFPVLYTYVQALRPIYFVIEIDLKHDWKNIIAVSDRTTKLSVISVWTEEALFCKIQNQQHAKRQKKEH